MRLFLLTVDRFLIELVCEKRVRMLYLHSADIVKRQLRVALYFSIAEKSKMQEV